MPTKPTDREILADLTEKMSISPVSADYDDKGHLVDLNLSGLLLPEIPSEIGRLTNLERLVLDNWPFKGGSRQLINYQQRDLMSSQMNQLDHLPSEIGQLTKLELLGLRGNQLSYLPQEIWQLTRLWKLDIS